MEEVRSYWQVASIAHFCTLFGKQFRLPSFEPEELEHAFILDIPNNKINNLKEEDENEDDVDSDNEVSNKIENGHDILDQDGSEDYTPPVPLRSNNHFNDNNNHTDSSTKNNTLNEEPHLLIKLAIPLLRPHFNCKIR